MQMGERRKNTVKKTKHNIFNWCTAYWDLITYIMCVQKRKNDRKKEIERQKE